MLPAHVEHICRRTSVLSVRCSQRAVHVSQGRLTTQDSRSHRTMGRSTPELDQQRVPCGCPLCSASPELPAHVMRIRLSACELGLRRAYRGVMARWRGCTPHHEQHCVPSHLPWPGGPACDHELSPCAQPSGSTSFRAGCCRCYETKRSMRTLSCAALRSLWPSSLPCSASVACMCQPHQPVGSCSCQGT